ncbi:hypothetical protein C1H46_033935 [Malus baccata]|uniref:Protein kinase domain-containing protein n=1 Tax=Malus baccata TaxID=106549 RepID=A0A540L2H9_MALBA|nr:hypothetical protein C1H46_033935 [Malus baccata]
MKSFWVPLCFFFLTLSISPPVSTAQLTPTEVRILLQVRKLLEYPEPLRGWTNWTNFCFLPPSPSLTIVCSNNRLTELTVIGNKTKTSPPKQSTLSKSFSIDSFFTTLTKLSNLKSLSLVSLGLWGPLPPKINRFWSLETLNLSSNSISGEIPASLSFIKNLTSINLADNFLNGSVPDLRPLTFLQEINLGNNKLGPGFPSLGNGIQIIVLRNNSMRSEIPTGLKNFDQLTKLDISYNKFVGPIPSFLFSLSSIQFINLSQNQLTGALSTNATCGKNLRVLDISQNLLIGKLPTCVGSNSKASNRTVLDSWNCLSSGNSKYQHPYAFCHREALAVKPPAETAGKKEENRIKLGVLLGLIAGIVGVACGVGLLVVVIVKRAGKRSTEDRFDRSKMEKISVSSSPKHNVNARRVPQLTRLLTLGLPPYQVFTLEEIDDATNNFDAANLIAEGPQGQVYKGWLRDGSQVQVKCVKLKQKQLPQNLKWSMEGLSKMRHKHLVGSESHLHGEGISSNSHLSSAEAEKEDIYQLGIILLQVLTGRLTKSATELDELRIQLEESLVEGPSTLREIVDSSMIGSFAYQSLKTAVEITVNCLSRDPSKRPSIDNVLWNLQYSIQVQDGWTSSGNLSAQM